MENEETSKPKSYTWLVIILVIILLVLAGLIVWMNLDKNETDDSVSSNTTTATEITNTTNNTASANTTTPDPVTTAVDDSASTSAARTAATNFLNNWSKRSLADSKPYMTATFYTASNQADFAGVSSPSRARFTISSTTAVTTGSKYAVVARCYQNLSGEEVGYTDNTLDVVKVADSFLVNAMTESNFTEK